MLITFRCERAQPVMMFSEVAFALLERMGLPPAEKGHIVPEDVPRLLERLEASLSEEAAREAETARARAASAKAGAAGAATGRKEKVEDDEREEKPVALAVRAFPLRDLLRYAHRRGYAVRWG